MCDEELAAAGVLARERHPHGAAKIGALIELVANRVARAAFAVAARIAVLTTKSGRRDGW
jgi:hypothetical protein